MPGFHTTVVFNRYDEISALQVSLIRAGMHKIMQQAMQEAKTNLFPGHGYDTGTLQKSIRYRWVEQAVYELYTNVEYAVYVEFGTSRMDAIPFFFGPAYAARPKVDALVAAVLAQGFYGTDFQ